MIQEVVVNEFFEEIERAKQPGYVSRYDDFDFECADGSRTKPARFDQPHAFPAEPSHAHSKAAAASGGTPNARLRREPSTDDRNTPHVPPSTDGGSFGAGIFPG